jgi:hypothetical protein
VRKYEHRIVVKVNTSFSLDASSFTQSITMQESRQAAEPLADDDSAVRGALQSDVTEPKGGRRTPGEVSHQDANKLR